MDQDHFAKVVEQTLAAAQTLLTTKGREYAGDDDRLGNFKRVAAAIGVPPLAVAYTYAAKHWDSIATFVRDEVKGTARIRTEPIEGRLDDLINYCILMKALIEEGTQNSLAESFLCRSDEEHGATLRLSKKPR